MARKYARNLIGANSIKKHRKKIVQNRGVINPDKHPKTERQKTIDSLRKFWVGFEKEDYKQLIVKIPKSTLKVGGEPQESRPSKRRKITCYAFKVPDNPLDLSVKLLYVRSSYVEIKSLLEHSDCRRALITGPPGVGVSSFMLFYLKDCLIKEKSASTILTRGFIKGYAYVLFASSMAFVLDSYAEALPYLKSPEVHYLVKPDSGESIPEYPARTFVIASFTHLGKCGFDLNGWTTFYVPSWSNLETTMWLKFTLPKEYDSNITVERVKLFGLKPCSLYDPERDAEIVKDMERIKTLTKRSFIQFKEVDSRLTIMDKDFHLMTALEKEDPSCATYKLGICSNQVAKELCDTFDSFTPQEMEELTRIGYTCKDSYLGVLLNGCKAYKAKALQGSVEPKKEEQNDTSKVQVKEKPEQNDTTSKVDVAEKPEQNDATSKVDVAEKPEQNDATSKVDVPEKPEHLATVG